MIKTLQRHGGDHALVLDRATIEMLGVREDTPLHVSVSGGSLIVTPVNVGVGRDEIDRISDDLQSRYGDMLRRLAE